MSWTQQSDGADTSYNHQHQQRIRRGVSHQHQQDLHPQVYQQRQQQQQRQYQRPELYHQQQQEYHEQERRYHQRLERQYQNLSRQQRQQHQHNTMTTITTSGSRRGDRDGCFEEGSDKGYNTGICGEGNCLFCCNAHNNFCNDSLDDSWLCGNEECARGAEGSTATTSNVSTADASFYEQDQFRAYCREGDVFIEEEQEEAGLEYRNGGNGGRYDEAELELARRLLCAALGS